LLAVKATDHKNVVPALSQRLMWVIVSVAVIDHAVGDDDKAIEPAEAAAKVRDCFVVFDEAAVVPDAPGSAVWMATFIVPAVNVVPVRPRVSSNLLAVLAADNPTVIPFPHSR